MSLKDGAGERIRTLDPRITSAPLYQLSYAGQADMFRNDLNNGSLRSP